MSPVVVLLALFLSAGCLNDMGAGENPDAGPTPSSVGGVPIYAEDMSHAYAPDPVVNGAPVKYSDIQAQFDSLGCTSSSCHGVTQVPVLVATPPANVALLNYYDLLSGCADGMPDPADCIDTVGVTDSLLLAKTCAASSITHAGGKPFPGPDDPTYVLWKGWIAAGAPY
jgi:hypothetical protein